MISAWTVLGVTKCVPEKLERKLYSATLFIMFTTVIFPPKDGRYAIPNHPTQ